MLPRILIIDTSYLIYKSYYGYRNFVRNGSSLGAVHGFVSTVMRLVDMYTPSLILFACDTDAKTWRHVIYSNYKSSRKPIEPDMLSQIPVIHDWLRAVTNNVFACSGWEADDIIYTLCCHIFSDSVYTEDHNAAVISSLAGVQSPPIFPFTAESCAKLSSYNTSITIFSADRDLYQLFLIPGVSFIHKDSGTWQYRLFNREDFVAKYGLQPAQWLDYKSLVGDPADDLPGAKGIGEKTAYKILSKYGSLYSFLKCVHIPFPQNYYNFEAIHNCYSDEKIEAKYGPVLRESSSDVEMTYKLSQLKLVPNLTIKKELLNFAKGKSILKKLNLSSLVKRSDAYSGNLLNNPTSLF